MVDRLFLTLVQSRVHDLETIRKDLNGSGIATPYIDSSINVMLKELETQEIASTPINREINHGSDSTTPS